MSALLVLGCLIWVIKFILFGAAGRVGRPPSGVLTRYVSPADAPVAAATMGGYALGTAIVLTDTRADSQTGILIGAVVAVFMAFRAVERLTVPALGVVGMVCAVIQTVDFIRGGDYDALKTTYRLALTLLVFTCFVFGTVIFNRASALRGERGLALLGVVDVVSFLARPTAADLFSLGSVSHGLFLVGAGTAAFAVGWAASEAVLGLVGIAVVGLSVALNAPNGWLGVVAAVAAACFTAGRSGLYPVRSRVGAPESEWPTSQRRHLAAQLPCLDCAIHAPRSAGRWLCDGGVMNEAELVAWLGVRDAADGDAWPTSVTTTHWPPRRN